MANLTPNRIESDDPSIPAILALLKTSFAYMDGRIDPPSSVHQLDEAVITEQAQNGEIWAIGVPPIACIFLNPQPDCLRLRKLAVAEPFRATGMGVLLLNHATKRAKDLGFSTIEVQTRVELIENQAIFERLGFTKYSEEMHPGYDRVTTYTYRKSIN